MITTTERKLIHAHFFFVDIVGLSNPVMSASSQIKKLDFLNTAISQCSAFRETPANSRIILPTGDGMAIGFLQGPDLPLELAIELIKKVERHNRGKLPADCIEVRIGVHSGPVFLVNDLNGNKNIWGPGIIIARRVMDLGDGGHILLSSGAAESLMTLYGRYKKYLHPLNRAPLKHHLELMIYSAYSPDREDAFGNGSMPKKIIELEPLQLFLYPYIEVNLSLINPEKMLFRHRRIQEVHNHSDGLLSEVTHQIATEVEKEFDDLNIKVYEEDGKEMAITEIMVDQKQQKEFATAFIRPLRPGQRRRYFLEYDLEEPDRYFENAFLTNCKEFIVTLDYPESVIDFKPIAFEMDPETGNKLGKREIAKKIERKNGRIKVRWTTKEGLHGQTFRFEW